MRSVCMAILLCCFPAWALSAEGQPDLGEESVITPAERQSQFAPAAAHDGKDAYLVVWRQGSGLRGGEADILGARVGVSGKVIDAEPIVISKAPDFQKRPAVAWSPASPGGLPSSASAVTGRTAAAGGHWLVVWQDARDFKKSGYDIRAARVSADGKLLDPEGIVLCAQEADQQMPAVASDGTGFLVVWADYRGNRDYDIHGCVVRDGKAGPPTAIIAGGGEQASPSVAWNGEQYLVVAGQKTSPRDQKQGPICRQVDRDGKPLGKPRTSGGQGGTYTAGLALAGQRALLVTTSQSGKLYNPNFCYALFLKPDGSLVQSDNPGRGGFKDGRVNRGTPVIRMTGAGGASYVFSPAAAGSGEWLLGLHDHRTGHKNYVNIGPAPKQAVHYALIRGRDGRVIAEGELAKGMRAAVAGDGAGHFLVAYERHGTDHKIAFRMLRPK